MSNDVAPTAPRREFSTAAKRVRQLLYEEFLAMRCCPNESWIADRAGLTTAELRSVIEELQRGLMVMLVPGTQGLIGKCPPWTSLPTRHVGRRDGHDGAVYLGCCFEAINYSYCHPGTTVTIDSSCPYCGAHIQLVLLDDRVISYTPSTTVAHIGISPALWANDWFAACDNSNFFCSSSHVDHWEAEYSQFKGARLPIETVRHLTNYRTRLDFDRGADGEADSGKYLTFCKQEGLAPPKW